MMDRMRDIVKNTAPPKQLGTLREFLQCMMLRALHEHHYTNRLAFVGGTALRLIFDLPRFSEDLDFSLIDKEGYDFKAILSDMKHAFSNSGLDVEVKLKGKKTVQSGWFSFPHLLHEMNLSRDPRRKLSIKVKVDTNPPHGAHNDRRVINRHFPLALVFHDLPSLFAGKLHAILTRQYIKGRDYYDLVWYLTRHKDIVPNIEMLNAALEQTGWRGARITEATWHLEIRKRIERADWKKIVADVSPFLEDERDIDAMTLEYVLPLLG